MNNIERATEVIDRYMDTECNHGPGSEELAEALAADGVLEQQSADDMISWLRENDWIWLVGTDDDFPDMVTAEVWRDGFANLGRKYTAPTLHAALEATLSDLQGQP